MRRFAFFICVFRPRAYRSHDVDPSYKSFCFCPLQHQKSSQWCQEHFLNYKGLLRAVTVREQLRRLLNKFKVPRTSSEGLSSFLTMKHVKAAFLVRLKKSGGKINKRLSQTETRTTVRFNSLSIKLSHTHYLVVNSQHTTEP